ncbi:hypothetical protein IHE44_0007634, partial [Lamprotornis superbus]
PHTLLRVYSCDLRSDGSILGSRQDGYNGWDFISFDLGSGRFVAADSAAEITRRRWEGETNEAESLTHYLGTVCPEWLQKYVKYGQKELERKEPPDVHVSGKEEHGTLILSCHAYGFYPSSIAVNWMKGDEIWDQETEWGGIPTSGGNLTVVVAVSIIAAIIILIVSIGFVVWKRQSGSGNRNEYGMAAREYQWWIQLWIPSVRIQDGSWG